jgi:UPF0716 protein FxsA
MRFLVLFFLLLPVIEIVLLIKIGSEIGVLATLGWLLLMIIAGVTLLRVQGTASLRQARELMSAGQQPTAALAKGVFVSFAAVLLILPGFATDTIGFLLLLPPLQQLLVKRWMKNAQVSSHFYQGRAQGNLYEGESEAVNDADSKPAQQFLPRGEDDSKR